MVAIVIFAAERPLSYLHMISFPSHNPSHSLTATQIEPRFTLILLLKHGRLISNSLENPSLILEDALFSLNFT